VRCVEFGASPGRREWGKWSPGISIACIARDANRALAWLRVWLSAHPRKGDGTVRHLATVTASTWAAARGGPGDARPESLGPIARFKDTEHRVAHVRQGRIEVHQVSHRGMVPGLGDGEAAPRMPYQHRRALEAIEHRLKVRPVVKFRHWQ